MAYAEFAYLYDRLMEEMPYPEWLDFLSQCWSKYGKPRTLADLGCGTGSLSIPLARQGIEVYGIDLSDDMLAVAQQKGAEAERHQPFPAGGSVAWLQQDMREWSLHRQVDAVISLCDCLNYLLEEEEVAQTFQQVFAGLNPGGLFVFDVHTPYQLEAYAEAQPFFLNEDDVAYIWTSELDAERCEIEHALTIFVSDMERGSSNTGSERFRRVDELHVQRAYPMAWLKRQLQQTGFSEVEMYGDFAWKSVTKTTQRAFFVARK
ncbi:class I SAM-dependent DNA methyltransferase [Paenibacillus sp. TAB 01]|uniref:class I SAM-dependent DNA methyltransferase n=1 Tax=Paenibacillus sp. TAB 01 TaxID=3368988 RepID=UPI003751B121